MLRFKKFPSIILAMLLCICFSKTVFAENKVDRISGSDRYDTSASISAYGWKTTSEYAIVATGEDFPDALSASTLAKKYNAPIILTNKNSLNASAAKELKRLNVKTVFIAGGSGVVSDNTETMIRNLGINVQRISGANRYETSVKIAESLDTTSSGIFLATGDNFPDALSAASLAAKKGMPIILTPKDSLDKSVQTYLSDRSISKVYVIGGEGVISSKVFNMLPNAERIYGNDRYETSIALLNKFNDDIDFSNIYLSTGLNFPDALSGSALAATSSSAIILTDSVKKDVTQKFIESKSDKIQHVTVLGGEGVLPFRTINKYIDLRKETVINYNVNVEKGTEENSYKITIKNLTPGDAVKIFSENTTQQLGEDIIVPQDKNEVSVDNLKYSTVTLEVQRGSIQSSKVDVNLSNFSNAPEIKVFNSGLIVYENGYYKVDRSRLPQSMKNFSKMSIIGFDETWNKKFENNIQSYNDSNGFKGDFSDFAAVILYDNDNMMLGYGITGSSDFLCFNKSSGMDIDSNDFANGISEDDLLKIKNAITPILTDIRNKEEAILAERKRQAEIARVKSLVTPSMVCGTMNYSSGSFQSGQTVEIIQDYNNGQSYRVYCNGADGCVPGDSVSINGDSPTNPNKMTKDELELYANVSGFKSSTSYFIWVDLNRQVVNIFTGSTGSWQFIKSVPCASGRNVTPTIRGTYTVTERGTSFGSDSEGARYWVRFYGNYMLHSILVDGNNNVVDGTLGVRASHGCVRLPLNESWWIYTYIPNGTTVWVN